MNVIDLTGDGTVSYTHLETIRSETNGPGAKVNRLGGKDKK